MFSKSYSPPLSSGTIGKHISVYPTKTLLDLARITDKASIKVSIIKFLFKILFKNSFNGLGLIELKETTEILAVMARSSSKVGMATGDVISPVDGTLEFDDDTLRGKKHQEKYCFVI